MKNILIIGPDDFHSFVRQVSNLIISRVKRDGKKIEFKDLDFGSDETRNDYNESELLRLPFDDAQKIFHAIIRNILSEPDLTDEIRDKLEAILQIKIKHDEDLRAIDEFDKIIFPESLAIKIEGNSRVNPQGIETYRGAVDDTTLEDLCHEIEEKVAGASKLFLMVNAHGFPNQNIWIAYRERQKIVIHPTELIKKIFTKGQEIPVLLDIYSCHAGTGIETSKEVSDISRYSENLPKSSTAILNSGHKTILMSFEKYLMNDLQTERAHNPDLNDDFSIFLYKIFQSPNTIKLIHKDANGKVHSYKHSFIKPQLAQDVSKEKIKEHVISQMQKFIAWCFENELGDAEKLRAMATKYEQRLDEEHLQHLGDMALSLESHRGRVKYVKCYEDAKEGYRYTTTPLKPIDKLDTEALDRDSKKLNSGALASNLGNWRNARSNYETATDESEKSKYKKDMDEFQEVMRHQISVGIEPNFLNRHGDPLLLLACKYQNEEVVRLLLEKGADPNSKNKQSTNTQGVVTLFVALSQGNFEITRMLVQSPKLTISREDLEKAVDANEKSKIQKTQIMEAFDASRPHEITRIKEEKKLEPGSLTKPSLVL